jgi:hypothetical protein
MVCFVVFADTTLQTVLSQGPHSNEGGGGTFGLYSGQPSSDSQCRTGYRTSIQ